MAPFDPSALVAMLLAFYPVVSGAAFVQARAERPEYFAGGVIFGSNDDKLRLPDGRQFDCIVAAGGPPDGRRWQCAAIDPTATGADDPFAREKGPIAFVDAFAPIFPGGDPSFEALVSEHLAALAGADSVLAAAGQAAITFTGAADLDASGARDLDAAIEAHAEIRSALDGDDPSDVLDATNRHDPEIDSARSDYVEQPPSDVPEPDVPEPPRDSDPREPPGRDAGI